jgi:hypothetical protein
MNIPDFQCECAFMECCQEFHDSDNIGNDFYEFVGHTSMREGIALAIAMGRQAEWFKPYQVSDYEAREVGDWKVGKFEVDVAGAFLHNRNEFDSGKMIVPGNYTGLYLRNDDDEHKPYEGWQIIMSDTPSEIMDHLEFIDKAYGRVLINGLGLGMVAHALLREDKNSCIEHIDIVECNQEVIDLVGHYFEGNSKVTIHHADAFEIQWPEDAYWHCAWSDLWYKINPDDYEQQNRLINKYKDRVLYHDCWMRRWIEGFLQWEKEKNESLRTS